MLSTYFIRTYACLVRVVYLLNSYGMVDCLLNLHFPRRSEHEVEFSHFAYTLVVFVLCVRLALAPMQALSIVSMPPKPFRCMPRFPLITRVSYTTTVCVLLPPDNQQSPCSATPLWKQKFDIGCTIIAGWSYQSLPCLKIRNQHQKHLLV